MGTYLGTTPISGATKLKYNAHSLGDFKWTDHILNEVSWVRGDNFSAMPGTVYTLMYNALVTALTTATEQTETIAGTSITYYRATNQWKIVLPDQLDNLEAIYDAVGVSWYWYLDINNVQFKCPRTQYGINGVRTNAGDFVDESLPNIRGTGFSSDDANKASTGAIYLVADGQDIAGSSGSGGLKGFNANLSSSVYKDGAHVQQRSTQMYLYFYMGEFAQTSVEQTAGLRTELFNNKIDADHANDTKPYVVETYKNGTSWYRVWSDKWCEQGGIYDGGSSSVAVTFAKTFVDTNYNVTHMVRHTSTGTSTWRVNKSTLATTGLTFFSDGSATNFGFYWRACGYIA